MGDSAKQNADSIVSNQEPEENIISYKAPRDYEPINSQLSSSSKDRTDWLYQEQAGSAVARGRRDCESEASMAVGLRDSTGLDGKLVLCSRAISNEKKIYNSQCHVDHKEGRGKYRRDWAGEELPGKGWSW